MKDVANGLRVYRAQLAGGGPLDGTEALATLRDVEAQALLYVDCGASVWMRLELAPLDALPLRVAAYQLVCEPTAAGWLRFNFDGYRIATAPEAR